MVVIAFGDCFVVCCLLIVGVGFSGLMCIGCACLFSWVLALCGFSGHSISGVGIGLRGIGCCVVCYCLVFGFTVDACCLLCFVTWFVGWLCLLVLCFCCLLDGVGLYA